MKESLRDNIKEAMLKPQPDLFKIIFRIIIAVIIVVLVLFINPFVIIPAGHRGVVFNISSGVKNVILGEGLGFRVPFLESVHIFDCRVMKKEFECAAVSSDLQSVQTTLALNFHLMPDKVNRLYQNIGEDYIDRIISPAVQESLKATTAQFNAAHLIALRPKVKDGVWQFLAARLAKSYIVLDEISLTDFEFSQEYQKAIESKQVAEQEALKRTYDLVKVKKEAEMAVAEAEGEKNATIAKAQGQAEQQRLLRLTLTPDLVRLKAIEKWDGKLPVYSGGGSVPLLDLREK
jgi:regulator of protease activity HflC (stomatin/prohibitin superfamily)